MMKKILYIITQSELGGAGRYVLDLALNLSKSHEIHIAAGGKGNALFDLTKGQNLTVHKLKHMVRSISPIEDFLGYLELKKLIRKLKPDIVHLNSSKAGVLGSLAAKKQKVPKIIYTAHGFVFNEPGNPIKRWLYTRAELGNAKRVHKIIAVSNFDRMAGIRAGINKDKIITIHNGIDASGMRFLPRDEARLSLRGGQKERFRIPNRNGESLASEPSVSESELGIQKRPWIGCIANFYYTKGLDILIRAMTKINAALMIIGEGHLRPELERQIKKLGLADKVFLLGSMPKAYQYLRAFDLFVLPSRKEGLAYTLLEAEAAQVPIVATRVGGTPEIVRDNKTGYLAPANSAALLAQKINQALTNPLAPALPHDCILRRMVAETLAVYRA